MSTLSSFFGGTAPKLRPSPYRAQQNNALTATAPLAGIYATNANRAGATVDRFQPGYETAVQDTYDRLRRGTTDAERTAQLAPTVSAINRNFAAGQSRVSADLARRGIVSPGGFVDNENRRVDSTNDAYRLQNDQEIAQRQNAPLQIAQLLGNVIGRARADQESGLRGQIGVNNTLFSGYGQMAEGDEELNARNAAAQAEAQRQLVQFFMQAGQMAGGGF